MRTVVTVKVHLKRQSTAFDLNRWVFKCFETSLGSLSLSPHVLAQKKHTLICLRFSFSSLQKDLHCTEGRYGYNIRRISIDSCSIAQRTRAESRPTIKTLLRRSIRPTDRLVKTDFISLHNKTAKIAETGRLPVKAGSAIAEFRQRGFHPSRRPTMIVF